MPWSKACSTAVAGGAKPGGRAGGGASAPPRARGGGDVADTTKASVTDPILCTALVACRDAQPLRIDAPGAPANRYARSFLRTLGISGGGIRVAAPPIRRPLVDVSGKVLNALRRGALWIHSNGRRFICPPQQAVIRPEFVWLLAAPRIAHAFPTPARGTLPLRFGGRTASCPGAVGGRLKPAHHNYRPVRIAKLLLPTSGCGELSVSVDLPELRFRIACGGDEVLVLEHRYRIATDQERRHCYLVDRRLFRKRIGTVVSTLHFFLLRSHPERATIHAYPVVL